MNKPGEPNKPNVLISGAAGGLGKTLVKKFSESGYHVIAVDIDSERLSLLNSNNNITKIAADVTDPGIIPNLRIETDPGKNGLDLLICAAGIYDTFPLTEARPEQFKRMLEVNLMGTVTLVQGLLKELISKKGRVIVVSSESYKVQALFQPYMISKASLEAYCIVARQELSLKGVKLSVIRPGAINTPLLKWMDDPDLAEKYDMYRTEMKKSVDRSIKMVGRISPPEQVADKIFKAATTSHPRRVYLVNNNPLLFLVALLPGKLMDWIVLKLFNDSKRRGRFP